MKILFSGYHNPDFLTITEYMEMAIENLGHKPVVFDDRRHIVPGRLRRKIGWLNKFDLNPEKSRDIEEYTKEKGMIFLGKIPFDPIFTKAMVQGQTIMEYDGDAEAGRVIRKIWRKICENLEIDA